MEKDPLNIKKPLLTAMFLSLLFAAAYGYLLFEIFAVRQTLYELEEGISLEAQREELLRAVRRTLTDTKEERTALNEIFVSSDGVVSFIERIEEVGRLSGVSLEISSVDILKPENGEDVYEWLTLSVEAEGSWQNIFHFLSLTEYLPVALFVESIRLGASEDDKEEGYFWHGSFDLRVAKLTAE